MRYQCAVNGYFGGSELGKSNHATRESRWSVETVSSRFRLCDYFLTSLAGMVTCQFRPGRALVDEYLALDSMVDGRVE